MTLEIQFRSRTGTQKYDGVKPVAVVQTNWIFNSNTYITNDNQIKQLRISSTVHHCISTMLIITFLFTLFSNIPKMQYLFLIISLILEEIVKVNLILDALSICTKTPQLKHVIMSCSMIHKAMYTT